MKRIDLHVHTTNSDGALSPKEVIDEAYKNNVLVISISDHDTIDSYSQELFKYASTKNIEIINGVEISTKYDNVGIHILGYNLDLNNEDLYKSLYKIRKARHSYLLNVSKKLKELGYFVNFEELNKIDAVTKAHIALDIINNEKNKYILLKNFKKIPNKSEFIESIMNENCPAYVEKESISPIEAAEIIRGANGKVVLAHPTAYLHEDKLSEKDILRIIHDIKADGIESNYIYVDKNDKKYDETKKWNKFARKNNLFATIGSDFHSKDGIRPEIGLINTSINFDNKKIDKIIEKLKS